MYGIGIFEILLIFLVRLLFFRPVEIYGLFRKMGSLFRRIKNTEDVLRKDLEAVMNNEKDGFSEVKDDDRKQ